MGTLVRRRPLRVVGALLLSFGIGMGFSTPSRGDDSPASLPDLVSTYDVGNVPADLLVVVDTSSSMSTDGKPPPWNGVVRGYGALVDAVGPSDRLGLITFDSTAAIRLDPTTIKTARDRRIARGQLPSQADGQSTDIGSALEAAVGRLSRGGAAEIQTLVFITDGKHQPPSNSNYPSTFGPRWQILKKRAGQLTESRRGRLNVYGWETGGGDTDIALVKNVFPDAQILAIPSDQISEFLASLATDAQRARVRPEVKQDLTQPVQSRFIAPNRLSPEMQAILQLSNPRTGLPTEVDLRGVTVTEADETPVPATLQPQTITLAPGATLDVPVALSPAGTDHGLTLGRKTDARQWKVQVDASTSLNEQLTTLLVTEQLASEKQTRGIVDSPGQIDASRGYGMAWSTFFILLGVLIAAIVGLVFLLKWLFVPPALSGQLIDANNEPLMRLSGREVTIPNAAVGDSEAGDSVRFFTKPRGVGRRVWVQRLGGSPRVRGDVLGRKAKRLFGRDRIVIGRDEITYLGRDTK